MLRTGLSNYQGYGYYDRGQYPQYPHQYPLQQYQQGVAQYYQNQQPSASYYQGTYYLPTYHCPSCGTPVYMVQVTTPQNTGNGVASLLVAVLTLLAIDIIFLRRK